MFVHVSYRKQCLHERSGQEALMQHYTQKKKRMKTGPDSLAVRASASGSESRGFAPRPRHTKCVKNGTGSSLADARNKRVVLGRYKNAGRYLLLVMSQ